MFPHCSQKHCPEMGEYVTFDWYQIRQGRLFIRYVLLVNGIFSQDFSVKQVSMNVRINKDKRMEPCQMLEFS